MRCTGFHLLVRQAFVTSPAQVAFFLLMTFFLPDWAVGAADSPSLSFGIVPQHSAKRLAQRWIPFLDYLSSKAGHPLSFQTAPDIPEFENRLKRGEYDLAYMNPYHYTVFSRAPGYRAFARQKGKRLQGVIVCRSHDPILDIRELHGKTLAFPSPAAFAASVLPRRSLAELGIEVQPHYVKSHDSVYMAVAKGLYPAGGGIVRTLNSLAPGLRHKLRILWSSNTYTPHAFTAHPRVEETVVAAIFEAMLAMTGDPAAAQHLEGIGFGGFKAAKDRDWDDVRDLQITELDDVL